MANNPIEELFLLVEIKEREIHRLRNLIQDLRAELWELRQGLQILSQPPLNSNDLREFLIWQYEQEIQNLTQENFELKVEIEIQQAIHDRRMLGSLEEASSSNMTSQQKEKENIKGKKTKFWKWKDKENNASTKEMDNLVNLLIKDMGMKEIEVRNLHSEVENLRKEIEDKNIRLQDLQDRLRVTENRNTMFLNSLADYREKFAKIEDMVMELTWEMHPTFGRRTPSTSERSEIIDD